MFSIMFMIGTNIHEGWKMMSAWSICFDGEC